MKKALVNSLPKAGTNLIAKCLLLFGYVEKGSIASSLVLGKSWSASIRRVAWAPFRAGYIIGIDSPVEIAKGVIQRKLSRISDGSFITAHVGYTADLLYDVRQMGFAPVLIIRDPRAVLASFVPFVLSQKKHPFHRALSEMKPEERFLAVLSGAFNNHGVLQPLKVRCMALDPWLESKDVLIIRFEDLVGSSGNASDELQEKSLLKLCDYLCIPKDRIPYAKKNLFGEGRHTFRKGNIDSWKEEIPGNVQDVINIEMKDVLQRWGYK